MNICILVLFKNFKHIVSSAWNEHDFEEVGVLCCKIRPTNVRRFGIELKYAEMRLAWVNKKPEIHI